MSSVSLNLDTKGSSMIATSHSDSCVRETERGAGLTGERVSLGECLDYKHYLLGPNPDHPVVRPRA
jgi:hypothetical protein